MEENIIRILSKEGFANRFYGGNVLDSRIDSEYENYLDEMYRIKFLVRNANNNDPESAYRLGLMLLNGEFFKANIHEAAYYFKVAAHFGHSQAAYEMVELLKQYNPQDEDRIRYFYNIYVHGTSRQQRAKDLNRER